MPPMHNNPSTQSQYSESYSGTKRSWASTGSDSDSSDNYNDSNDSGKKKKLNRMLLRDWLVEQTNGGCVPGLEWLDKEKTLIKVPWTHASRHGWDENKDSCLFRAWAIYTERYNSSPPKKWKANFRCAMNSLPDVVEDKARSSTKGSDAYKVYQLKTRKNRSVVSHSKKQLPNSSESTRFVTKADRIQRTKLIKENSKYKHMPVNKSEHEEMKSDMTLHYNNMENYNQYDGQNNMLPDQPPMIIPKTDISDLILQELKQASSNLELYYHQDSGSEMKYDDQTSSMSPDSYKFIPTVVEETSDYNSNCSEEEDSNDMPESKESIIVLDCHPSQTSQTHNNSKYQATNMWNSQVTYDSVISRFNNLPTTTQAESFTTEYTALSHNSEHDLAFESM